MKRKSVLIISHFSPFPPRAGNEYRLSRLIIWLHEKGFDVYLVIRELNVLTKIQHDSCKENVNTLYLFPSDKIKYSWFDKFIEMLIQKIGLAKKNIQNKFLSSEEKKHILHANKLEELIAPLSFVTYSRSIIRRLRPSIVIAEYVFMSRILIGLPRNILKVIDTVDLFSTKKEKVIDMGVSDSIYLDRAVEADFLRRADVILAIQQHESKAISSMVSNRTVIKLPVDFSINLSSCRINEKLPIELKLLLVASDNPLNRHGLKEFLEYAWPEIVTRVPTVCLRIVGKVTEGMRFDQPNLEIAGQVDNLDSEYINTDIVLNPIRVGTGLKIKSVEALCHGKPLVCFPNGVDGFPEIEDGNLPYVVVQTWQDFRDAIIYLLENPEKRANLANYAASYAIKNFSKEQVFSEFESFLQSRFLL